MRSTKLTLLGMISASVVATAVCAGEAPKTGAPILESETSDVARLPPINVHTLLLGSLGGGRAGAKILDGDTLKILGSIPSDFFTNYAISPDNKSYYLAETYYSRGNRGVREDLLTEYDPEMLTVRTETKLPGRLIAVMKTSQFALSSDGKRAYVYNFQPSSSVILVDLEKKRVASRVVEIPGCAMIFPFGARGFASLCADGSLASVNLEESGKYQIEHTRPFFDAERDPIFEEGVVNRNTGEAFFISYTGLVYPASLSDHSTIGAPWSLQRAANLPAATAEPGLATWRPGGTRIAALHGPSARLYVLMHDGEHWDQKAAGTQIWILDARKQALITRISLATPAKGVAVSQDDKPILFAVSEDGEVFSFDALTGKPLLTAPEKVGNVHAIPVVPGT